MSAIDEHPFPRSALFAAATMIAITIALVSGVRLGLLPRDNSVAVVEAGAVVVSARSLTFEIADTGPVVVRDADGHALVATLPAGQDGFVRGVMRGMAYHRGLRHIPATAPFVVSRLSNGALILEDPRTDRKIDLTAFGAANKAAFAHLLDRATVGQ